MPKLKQFEPLPEYISQHVVQFVLKIKTGPGGGKEGVAGQKPICMMS